VAGAAVARKPPRAPDEEEAPRGNFDALLAQANRLLENGKGKEAQRLFEKARQLQPDSVEVLNGLGYCDLDTEHFVAAVDKFRLALSRSPANGDAIIGIAEAYKMRGDKPHALEYYKKYEADLPHGSKIRMAETNVHEIEAALNKAVPATAGEARDVPPPPPP
jgi:tetratricopeptide (TPR) repeat protein